MPSTPLLKKLRIVESVRYVVLNPPSGYVDSLRDLPSNAFLSTELIPPYDIVHLFIKSAAELKAQLPPILETIQADNILWVSYPKQSAKIEGVDLNRDSLWELMKGYNLRPVSQIAVDEVWSALRFKPVD